MCKLMDGVFLRPQGTEIFQGGPSAKNKKMLK